MKAWYDDIDAATLQRIKTYSAFNDPESKNLMVQTMYEYKQEEIAELEKACEETQELLDKQIEATYRLDKENAELKSIADFQQSGNMSRYFELKRQAEKLEEAKELLKKLLVHSKRYIWIADDNNKPIMQKEIAEAEHFLSEVENEKHQRKEM